jgi:hypothetical protein
MALPRRADGSVDVLALIRETSHLVSGRELDDDGPYDRRARLAEQAQREAQLERTASMRVWSAGMLALDRETFVSILRRLPVRAGNLDPVALRYARRGRRLPSANSFVPITDELLDAIAESESVLVRRATQAAKR